MPIYNREQLKARRRELRGAMPRSEVLLWSKLRCKQLDGFRFRRQYSVGAYCLDFYCPKARLAIEVDGNSHFGDGAEEQDAIRQSYIESFGIQFLRSTNGDIINNISGVLETILRICRQRVS